MKVVDKRPKNTNITFEKLDIGDVFTRPRDAASYIKISVNDALQSGGGYCVEVSKKEIVIPLEAELHIIGYK